ncbi:MAG TPA: S41 family peptidase [Vicinamibacterales bacterium]|nr:S41 family peptidase [Vicinamibacterales bacterium]
MRSLLPYGCASLGLAAALAVGTTPHPEAAQAAAPLGYYRFPAIHNDTLVFTAEGDLWQIGIAGGIAQRLTAHPSEESRPAVSPDGRTLAFSAAYEGPTEVYTLPLDGGIPTRQTYDGAAALVVGWTPAGEILYSTRRYSTLPNTQLVRIDPGSGARALLPLAQASDGAYHPDGRTLFFTRLAFQGSYTKRYQGGTAQNIWRFAGGDQEAAPLTADYQGTSKHPMPWKGRLYFLSDRDGHMNVWSMAEAGGDLRQHTKHVGLDAQWPSLSNGRIAYQLGADLRIYDIERSHDRAVPIRLVSDFDQLRERWVKTPMDWVTSAHLSPTGDRVVLNARGQLFVAPALQGRIVEATRDKRVRYRVGRFFPDGRTLLTLGDATGEVEFWRVPANGVGESTQVTTDGKVLRWDGIPSPDGARIAHYDKDQQLWVYDVASKQQKQVAKSDEGGFGDVRWSPDGKWLAYTAPDTNQMTRLYLFSVDSAKSTPITTDRYDSYSPEFSPDGKWLYFLSDRSFVSLVGSPWGSRQPEPFFDKQTKIFHVSMKPGERSPFHPDDELSGPTPPADKPADKPAEKPGEKPADKPGEKPPADKPPGGASRPAQAVKPAPPVTVDLQGIQTRLLEVPLPAGNYNDLANDGKRLYFTSRDAGAPRASLKTLAIENKSPKPETFMEDVTSYELSQDRKKLLVRKAQDLFIFDVAAKAPQDTTKNKVPLADWVFKLDPRDEWRQMFTEAWRLERDYFYDRGMHGVDWPAMKAKYLPLVDRVTDRAELSDILAQMVGELSALHIFVRGGDMRRGGDQVEAASLGATFTRDDKAGGFRVAHIYKSDPDIPEELAPLARVNVHVAEGDVIESINGIPTLSARDISALLRNQAGRQMLLKVKPKAGGAAREVVVMPISQARENDLRYDEWEYTRRLAVEKATGNRMGYVHLRAMGAGNMAEWQREFYPVFDREGLIIDVRHNNGGNIDSWILEKLLRKAWFFWQPRVGNPTWNMQYAFRGHLVVLVDENTASDGEAFAEGVRRLGLGKVIGTRTWGGEIWLSQNNFLVDRGIATAAETGVFGPEGDWLIEGHGVDPDIVVQNLPHATFKGGDAQLEAAIKYLEEEIKRKPIPKPVAPKYPDKSIKGSR